MLYTTRLHDIDNEFIKKLTLEDILDELSEKDSVYIVSAYYRKETIEDTLGRIGRGKDVSIIISKLGAGSKIAMQIEELIEIKTTNRQKIFLSTSFPLMHSKIYYGTSNNVAGAVCFVGSANLSWNGFHSNEEILVQVSDLETKRAIRDYIDRLIDDKGTILINEKARFNRKHDLSESLVSYISRGFIIFKPTTSFSITYTNNDLKEYAKTISDQSQQIRHSKTESQTVIKIAEIAGISDLIDNIDNQSDEDEEESKKHNIAVRSNCIETCLGYWLPEERYEQINDKLENTQSKREYSFKIIIDKLTQLKTNRLVLVKAIDEFTEDFLTPNHEIKKDAKQFKNELHKSVIRHIETKIRYLKRNKDRYIRGLYITPMPHIWDDSITVASFISSFVEDVLERSKYASVAQEVLELFDLAKMRDKDPNAIIMKRLANNR